MNLRLVLHVPDGGGKVNHVLDISILKLHI